MAQVEIDIVGHDNFSGVLGNFGSIITGIESAINLAGRAFDFFKDQAMAGLDAIASYERLELSLQSLVASQMVQAGVAEDINAAMEVAGLKAAELVEWNEQLAINSPFTSEGVAQAFRMAMAYGFTVDEAKRLTEAMIDFAAGSGASEYAMQQIARALGQISATGKLTGGDMLQLVNAGLPVAQILADAFGITTAQVMKMREKGLIPAKDAIEAITVYLETNFAGAAERQATSWAGLKGTFEDLKQMGLREFFGGLFDALQPVAVELSTWLQGPGLEKLREWGAVLGGFADQVIVVFGRMFEAFHDGATIFDAISVGLKWIGGDDTPAWIVNLAKAVETAGDMFRNFFDTIRSGGTAMEAFGNALFAIGGDDTPQWLVNIGKAFKSGDWSTVVQSIVDSLTGAIDGANWSSFGQSVARILTGVIETVLKGLDVIVNRVDWGPFGEALLKAIGEVLSGMGSVIGKYVYWDNWVAFFKELLPKAIIHGLTTGILDGFGDVALALGMFTARVIAFFKNLLGIASPSTVFYSIGKDIVQGLINGILGMFPSLTSVVGGIFDLLTGGSLSGVMGNIFDSLTGGRSTGSIGGRSTADTGGTMTGGGNTFNFYGPIYVGSLQELVYDCVSPHPLLAATAGAIGGR